MKVVLRDHWRDVLRVGGLYLAVNSGVYMIFVCTIAYLTDKMKIEQSAVMDINVLCIFILTLLPNLCMAIFGGTTPLVATYLVQRSGDGINKVFRFVLHSPLLCVLVLVRVPRLFPAGQRLCRQPVDVAGNRPVFLARIG